MKSAYALVGATLVAVTFTGVAKASTVNLSATYYEVLGSSGDPDFSPSPRNTPSVGIGSSLGADGLPVAAAGSVHDLANGNQITWWSPTLNSHVVQTGAGTISLPYSNTMMYAPNSTGANDATYFETAKFTGFFNLTTPESVTFNLGSDDDSFIYVDGTLIGGNPGIHALDHVTFSSGTLAAGEHSIEVFYADRAQTGAELSLSLTTPGIDISAPAPVPGAGLFSLAFVVLARFSAKKREIAGLAEKASLAA